MKLIPQQAPLYGRCVITVQLSDDELCADEEGVDYFLLFAGSTQWHLTSTLRSNNDTLQALCPAHDCCEVVLVTLCSASCGGVPEAPKDPEPRPGRVAPLAEHRFSFVQDLAFDMAQFLVSTAGRADGLDGALLLDECQIPLEECERLDESLALALTHLALPPGWSLLGNKVTNSTDLQPQETLLHFSARRGLFRVTHFLLQRSGAREALRLANRQGHTPYAVAALRGHERLLDLLKKAESDTETDKGLETVQLASADARVVCHLPRLNTHTLTLSLQPGHDPPHLQRSVDELLHLTCHLHAKGVSVLELKFDSLHTAAECCEGVDTETTCLARLRHPTATSESLDAATGGGCAEKCSVESCGSVVCGHGGTENTENDWSLSANTPESEVRSREHGLCPPEDWVCLSSNTGKDCCQIAKEEEEEEGREQPVVSSQSVSLCDGSIEARSEADGESLIVGIPPAAARGNQAEETDREEAVIWEGQEATEGKESSGQEEEDSTVTRREEETNSESTQLRTPCEDTKASVMGQSPSAQGSEVSDASDREMKDCCEEGEHVAKEAVEFSQEFPLDEEKAESEGFPEPVSTSGDLPNPPLINGGDVIEEPESAVPCFSIEGLHEGEPPPDINSLEQNQETAGRDYTADQHLGLAPQTDCHSENCTGTASSEQPVGEDIVQRSGFSTESSSLPMDGHDNDGLQTAGDSTEDLLTDQSPELMPSNRNITFLDSGLTFGLSSDDDGSFRSVGSSTTEIFHPTQDSVSIEDSLQNKVANDLKPDEGNEHFQTLDAGDSLELGIASAPPATDCCQTLSDPELQLSQSLQTMEALNHEGTGEEPAPELFKENLSLAPAPSESLDSPTGTVDESQTGEASSSELNAPIEDLPLDVTSGASFEPSLSIEEGEDIVGPVEGDNQSTETSDTSASATAEHGGDLRLEPGQPKQEDSEMTADEGLMRPENQISLSLSQDVTPLSDSADVDSADVNTSEVEPPSSNNEASSQAQVDNEQSENPENLDAVDGMSHGHGTAVPEEEVIMSEEPVFGAEDEENGQAEKTNVSTINRDRETSFHQPCSTQLSESSQPCPSPSLPSRSSSATSCPSAAHRDSGSDIESLSAEPGYDCVFSKNDEAVTCGDSTSEVSVSCSSTDDTASVGPSSSSPEGSQGLGGSWSPEEGLHPGVATTAGGLDSGGGEAEEEAKDRVSEVPRRSCILRNSLRSLSPLRRHSWGPGKNHGADAEMNQRSSVCDERKPTFHRRSYSLEGLSGGQEELRRPTSQGPQILEPSGRMPRHDSDDRGSLVSLTEEKDELGGHGRLREQKSRRYRPLRNSCPPMSLPLTKSVSMLAISQRDIDAVACLRRKRRISFSFNLSPILHKSKSEFMYRDYSSSDDEDNFSMRSYSSTSGSLAYSISEEEPGPLRSDTEGRGGTKVSRTFSYLKNKMYKKTREKDRDKREKEKEGKEKDKKAINGHLFSSVSLAQSAQCVQCNKAFNSKEAFQCSHCNASVHKGCRDSLPVCAKVKMKLPKQLAVPDSSSFPTVTMRNKSAGTRERPWSAILSPEDHSSLMIPSRRHTSIMGFHGNNLSKSLSISNIAGPVFDEMPIKGLRYLSQSTDSLNRTNQVTESMESLTDEGTEMMDGQLMGEFEAEAKELEADSWSLGPEQQHLQQPDRELAKRQDVIYELMQTEMHHIRTLRIMSEVYSKGLQKEVQLEPQTVERMFPALDELLEVHTQLLSRLLERKRDSQQEGGGFVIHRIGDVLLSQFSGSYGENMKRVYGRFCSRHNEAVNFYKDLLTKDKRFKAFIKKKMSSSIVRRLGIPECILLVTQRITKYPVLIQRILQNTKESEEDFEDLRDAVRLVKEVIVAVDSKVNEHDKRRRLKDFHCRTDNKSLMTMKSGQVFAREDLLRRRLIHDGVLQLKNSQGRLKDVHALLLSDVFVFLQEKDQKYVFAMLDQRSTVISLQKLIVREVANEERGLFLISAGVEKPEMMEVLAGSKDERNSWMNLIQEAMQSMEKDEDEGIPSETEDDKRQLEIKAKELRDLLKQKDTEIVSLLEEKVRLFRGMWEGLSPAEELQQQAEPFFRSASGLEPPRGAEVMKDALQEVETLQALVNGSLGGAMASAQDGAAAGPVCLPRRAETFGGFDSHQMHSSKSGDREESEDAAGELRRTESDGVLKKGGNANLLHLLKRNSEQVLNSVSNLHMLLSTLQAVVVQQDSFIEDQRMALSERSSSCSSLSRPSSRPSSLIEQEKQRSLEKQRQEVASLQRQQAAHADNKKRREKEWEVRESLLAQREENLHTQEEEFLKQSRALQAERQQLDSKKEDYQRDLERLRDAQRKLERDREALQRHLDNMDELGLEQRTLSTTSEDSQSVDLDPLELSSFPPPRQQSQKAKPKGKSLNPFTSSSSSTNPGLKASEANSQLSKNLLQLAKNKSKEGKDKKKKKGKGGGAQTADPQHLPETQLDGEIFFC